GHAKIATWLGSAPDYWLMDLQTIFGRMDALAALTHIRGLDEEWARLLQGKRPPDPLSHVRHSWLPATDRDVDIVYAGGGLGLIHALAMQQRGWGVLLFDRGVVGATHREWNITRGELDVLVQAGILRWEELEGVIAREYRSGFVRFHNPQGSPVRFDLPGVLDLALDASGLLSLVRRKFEAAGGIVWDNSTFEHVWLAVDAAPRTVVRVRNARDQTCHIGARLLVNAMGMLSPLSLALAGEGVPVDGVCPTVGTVACGFAEGEVDPHQGEILVTLEGQRDGHQLIWEGFPAHDHTFTTYLFYYDVTENRASQPHSLVELFHDYFELFPTYKTPGHAFKHLKPVYGFIPARHHLDGPLPEQARTARALLSIGDAAARQNPLTFTGFGSFVRHLPDAIKGLDTHLQEDLLEAETLARFSAAQRNLSAMWVLARFLAPRSHPDAVNAILRDFTRALEEVGPERASAFFLDRATWRDYVEIMLRTARHHPQVFFEAFEVLGTRGVAQWLEDLARWGLSTGSTT
ncbi:MAG: hypothetical protein M3220_06310, partial [Chloroflexota bacterium]|nr:hypothetical protein [Chloroflexota bacterium]